MAHRVSKDSGKTIEQIEPIAVAKVYPNKVKGPKGDFSDIEKIVEVSQGQSALYLITLSNGVTWAAIEKDKPGDYQLQILSGQPQKEVIRFETSIESER